MSELTIPERALPEKYRLVRNIEDGYEIRVKCPDHNADHWLRVTRTLHITAPLKVSSLHVEPVAGELDCLGDGRISANPATRVWSRRPAGVVS